MRGPAADAARHPAAAVLVIVGVLVTAGLTIDATVLDRTLAPDSTSIRALLLIAVAFAVGEAVVMHVELGKNAHSVSLAELTLTVGLFFLAPYQLAAARLIGGGVVLIAVRRQRPLKLVFNLALWTCDVAVAALVFRSLGGTLAASPPRMALSAGLAALTAAVVDSIAVNVVIAATSRELDLRRSLRFLGACLLSAAGCVTGGLICVAALRLSAWFVIPIGVVAAVYLYAFSRLASLQAQITNVRVLNDFAAELAGTRHGHEVARTVLHRTASVLRADRATLYLHDGATGAWQLSDLLRGDVEARELPDRDIPSVLQQAIDTDKPIVLRAGSRHPAGGGLLRQLDVRDAVLAPVRGERHLEGVLVVADRQGEVNTFNNDDGLLLEMLARHASSALSNSRLVEQLDHDSQHDPLTGLANRSKFYAHLTTALQDLDSRGDHNGLGNVSVSGIGESDFPADSHVRTLRGRRSSVAVLLMDLDRFKEVNDTLGHHHGDLLLQLVADRLQQTLLGHGLLARLGGDEFAVLLSHVSEEQAVATAERMVHVLGQTVQLQGVQTDVGASIGVAFVDGQAPAGASTTAMNANALMQRADVAMYAAKQHYTGVHLYRDELDGYSPRRLAMAGGLRTAIEAGQLTVHYQPQALLPEGGIVGVEALVRWNHPLYGQVAPDEFIGLAEQTGLIRDLTRYVLDAALGTCARLRAAGLPLTVSVNLSARNLLEPDLVAAVQTLLTRHDLPGRDLILEITESHLMIDPDRTAEILRELAAAGVRISIDDFGTGYSSLAYLKRLPVTEVKIDKSFVQDLADDDTGSGEDSAIIASITTLAHTLRLDVVAEGVEDAATLDKLQQLGCDAAQGYHLAKPMTAGDLTIWLARQQIASRAPRLRPLPAPRVSPERRRNRGRA